MMDRRRLDDQAEREMDLPPASAAAHFEAIAKGIGDVYIVVQSLLGRVPPTKPWQRQLLLQLADADRHIEILRLAIYLERDAHEISEAAAQLRQILQTAHVQISGGRADGWTKNAVSVALRTAGLVSALLEP